MMKAQWPTKEASALPHRKPEEKDPSEHSRRAKHEVSAPLDPGRTDLYMMISRLPEEQLETARRFLRFLIVDAGRSVETEYDDDEPLTPEDLAAISEARAAIARGEFMTLDELERRLDGKDINHG